MSFPHCVEPLPLPTPTAALGTLRARGLRISTTRREVVDALFAAEGPVTAEELARCTRADLGSVYRNLEALEAAGIARHVHVGHAAGRYVLSGRHAGGYAACERCGKHVPLDDLDGLRAAVRELCGFACDFAHFPLVGACPDVRGLPMIDFHFLFKPVEHLDDALTGLFHGAPLLVALGIAFLLGLRHATDPDHLMAVTSLVARDAGGTRSAARLGAVWGAGHAIALLLIGLPLILLNAALPPALESTAEKAVGVVIVLLALRVLIRWLHRNRPHEHDHPLRTPRQAFGIGLLHGLAGTGAVVLLLIAALPSPLAACAALAIFAPMSAVSMALCTSGFAWTLTRPAVLPVYRTVLMPALGAMGLLFGIWYIGLA